MSGFTPGFLYNEVSSFFDLRTTRHWAFRNPGWFGKLIRY